jgi:hypothetical protein
MYKLVGKIEIPLKKREIENAGLYNGQKSKTI